MALGNKEHIGRTRGKGLRPWKVGFKQNANTYKKRRKENIDEMIAILKEELQEER